MKKGFFLIQDLLGFGTYRNCRLYIIYLIEASIRRDQKKKFCDNKNAFLLYVQEGMTHKMGHYFLDTQYEYRELFLCNNMIKKIHYHVQFYLN